MQQLNLKPKLKKYHYKKRTIKQSGSNNYQYKIFKAVLRYKNKGLWQQFSPKMQKTFLNPKNWTISSTNQGAPYLRFKYLKQFKGSLKGQAIKQKMYSTSGIMYFIKQKNDYLEEIKDVPRLNKKQTETIMKLNKKILWSQFYNAKTQQRKEFLKERIKRQSKETYNLLSSQSELSRAQMSDFIFNFHYDIIEKYKSLPENAMLGDYEVYEKYKEAIFIDLALDNLNRGKKNLQEMVYWDEYSQTIIYLDW